MQYLKLNNGLVIPCLGFGIHHYEEGIEPVEIIEKVLASGARLIETASSFFNEKSMGIGIKNACTKYKIKREDIFISTKLHDDMQGYEFTKQAFRNSLEKIGVDYIDLFAIRHPLWTEEDWKTPMIDSWRAMEELYQEGKIRAIGVANFSIKYLSFLLEHAKIKPMINQIEIHPKYQQREIQEFCTKNNITISSWATLNYGRVLYQDTIIKVARKYGKSPVQIVLRWHIQQGHLTMTRSSQTDHIKEDLDVFNFELSDIDMELINSLDGTGTATWPLQGIVI